MSAAIDEIVEANHRRDFAGAVDLARRVLTDATCDAAIRRAARFECLVGLVALCRNNALKTAADLIQQESFPPAELLVELGQRLEKAEIIGSARARLRKLVEVFGEYVTTDFVPRSIDTARTIEAGQLGDLLAGARRGTPLDTPAKLVFPRDPARISIGRNDDVVLLLPRLTLAGVGTPYFFGGHTPMSAAGYWVPGFIQGGAAGKGGMFRDELLRWQASTLKRNALEPVSDAIFVAAGGGQNNFGHALFNCLPSLYWYKALRLDCPIVFPRLRLDIAPSLAEAIDLVLNSLDIPPGRVMAPETLRNKSFALGILPNQGDFSPETVSFYRRQILDKLATAGRLGNAASRPFIYVSRRRARARRIANEDEIVARVARLGFEIVEPEILPFVEQVRLFDRARVVVGPHGSGFNNMFFAKPGTHLIEIRTVDRDDFLKLAASASQTYTPIQARTILSDGVHRIVFEDFDGLDRACRQALGLDAIGKSPLSAV